MGTYFESAAAQQKRKALSGLGRFCQALLSEAGHCILSSVRNIPLAFSCLAFSLVLMAYKDGPLPNLTGGFGERSCRSCHLDNPLNATGGTLSITGVPRACAPGKTYSIAVSLEREGMKRAGFEMSARFGTGEHKAKQAGSWRSLDQRAQVVASQTDPSVQFVQHTTAGTLAPSRGANKWSVEWTAPDELAGPVQFNLAANASNDDASPLGDFIYLKQLSCTPAK